MMRLNRNWRFPHRCPQGCAICRWLERDRLLYPYLDAKKEAKGVEVLSKSCEANSGTGRAINATSP